MTPWKRRLRRLVVWTARGPLDALYRRLYAAAIAVAAAVLGRFRSVAAIYLIRGAAKDGVIPGISDIDLVVITADDSEIDRVRRRFRALGALTRRTIDYNYNFLHTRAAVHERWRTSPVWQAMYLEGRTSWRLLRGTDVLAELPPLGEMERRGACHAEMSHWWLLFARHVLTSTAALADPVMAGSMAYKAATEVANAWHALATGAHEPSRAAGLARLDAGLADRLRAAHARRFLTIDDALLDDVLAFLMDTFLRHWAAFPARPFCTVDAGVRQRVDCPRSELAVGPHEAARVEALCRRLDTAWGAAYRGATVVKSAFFDLDDLLLVVDAETGAGPRPSARAIAALGDLHGRGRRPDGPALHLFLRRGSVVFPITPHLPRDYHRGVLLPATVPDVFLQLGVDGACWTDFTRWYLSDPDADALRWPAPLPAAKRAQLAAIARSCAEGEVVYPLTGPALARAAA